jgi:hypothetical protein
MASPKFSAPRDFRAENNSFDGLSCELLVFVASFFDYPELKSMQAALPALSRDQYICEACSKLWNVLILASWASRGGDEETIRNREVASFEESLIDDVGRACASGSVDVPRMIPSKMSSKVEPAEESPLLPLRKRVMAQRAFSCLPPSWPRTFCDKLLSLSGRHKVNISFLFIFPGKEMRSKKSP